MDCVDRDMTAIGTTKGDRNGDPTIKLERFEGDKTESDRLKHVTYCNNRNEENQKHECGMSQHSTKVRKCKLIG